MKKIVVTLFACMSLATLGMDALELSQPTSQEPVPTKEISVEKHCERGPRGHRGHRGPRGHRGHHGKIGPIGPQGPAGTSAAGEFGEAYLIPSWTQSPPSQFFIPNVTYGPVQFTDLGPLSSGVTYNPATWTFTVNTPGTYTIEFAVKAALSPNSLITGAPTTLNAKVVISGVDQVPTMASLLSKASRGVYGEAANQITRVIPAGATIQLQAFIATNTPTFIYGISGDAQEAAYISIEKIGE
jgi:hypothetical protein